MAGAGSRPGRAALVLVLIVAAILAYMDLSSSHSTLRGLWNTAFPSSTRGERVRDTFIDGLKPRR